MSIFGINVEIYVNIKGNLGLGALLSLYTVTFSSTRFLFTLNVAIAFETSLRYLAVYKETIPTKMKTKVKLMRKNQDPRQKESASSSGITTEEKCKLWVI